MFARIGHWWRLPRFERWQFLLMLLALPVVSLGLRLAGYMRCRRWVEALTDRAFRAATPADLRSAERLAQLAEKAGRNGAWPATCLRQSLLVYGWLRARGLTPELKLGVRKGSGGFDAHAWLELEGSPLAQAEILHAPLTTVRAAPAINVR